MRTRRSDIPAASRLSPRAIMLANIETYRARGDAAKLDLAERALAYYDAREAERVASFAADLARAGVSL
jgi:hypothetical protein